MFDFAEQKSVIKFLLRNEISVPETFRKLQKAFGKSARLQGNAYKWFKDFKESRKHVDDLERLGRTWTDEQDFKKVKELVLENV